MNGGQCVLKLWGQPNLLLTAMPQLTGQWVDVSCSVTDDQQVVIVCGVQALATQAQSSCTHALQLGVGAQRSRDEGVLWICKWQNKAWCQQRRQQTAAADA